MLLSVFIIMKYISKTGTLSCLFFLILSLSCALYANDPYDPLTGCGGSKLKNALSALRINPSIKKNGQFLEEVSRRFGTDLRDAIVAAHPAMAKADKSIDIKTVKWMLNEFFSADKKEVRRVFMSPFRTEKNNYGAELVANLMVSESWPDFISIPLFTSKDQLEAVRLFISDNNFKEATYLFVDHFGTDKATGKLMAKTLYEKVFEQKNYRLGFDKVGANENMITFIGHGLPGDTYLELDDVNLHFSEIIFDMLDSGLPRKANIEIAACYGACGPLGRFNQVDLTSNQLKQAFLDKTIQDHIGKKDQSFGYLFSKTLHKLYPEFDGRVIAYNGEIIIPLIPAYVRDPLDPNKLIEEVTYAVGLTPKDSKESLYFDANEMYQVYMRDNFPK